uniref:Pseudouridine synthase n=1 Tax=uncultured bacterium contig00016 TaxID=1181507 RepID=A0A806KII8_9BACT|nr:ribosomal large subunit pseudouridine synthase B [uncultured bacterium contig00016]
MRINQYISQCGAASRRKAEALVLEGKVSVNGIVVKELSTQIGETDIVEIEGQKISPVKQRITIAFHKPPGVICTASDPQRRKTIYDCLPSGFSTLKYVGRLDLQSRGLVLLSDDGELVHRLTHPRYQIERSYLVWTSKELSRRAIETLLSGIDIGDGEIAQAKEIYLDNGFFELVLTEGKNREIRKMLHALHYHIEDLKRISFANIVLGDLAVGDYREVKGNELRELKALVLIPSK